MKITTVYSVGGGLHCAQSDRTVQCFQLFKKAGANVHVFLAHSILPKNRKLRHALESF